MLRFSQIAPTCLAVAALFLHGATALPEEKGESASVGIHSPKNYQVFQRSTLNEGPVRISGFVPPGSDQVQVRFRGETSFGTLPEGWQNVALLTPTGQFNQTMILPAGGWYAMDLRVLDGDKVIEETTVEKLGVGEVFVGAGQSNSTNSGQFPIQQHTGMVSSFSGEHWQIANDPQPGTADRSTGGSFWPAFGDAMYEKYQVPIGVATTGFGGTSLNQWQPEEGLFKWMMTRVHQLGSMGFRAILWHQGESDVERMTSDEYYNKMKIVIDESQKQAGWEIPWFVAQVSYHNPSKPSFDTTRTAQAKLWKDGVALEGPDTDTLTGEMRDHDGKGIHFSPKGLKIHGEMWAEKVSKVLDKTLGK